MMPEANNTAVCLYTKSLEGLLAVRSTVEKVVVHAGHDALLVQDVRDAAVDGAEHGALHLPLLAHLMVIAFKGNGESKRQCVGNCCPASVRGDVQRS